MLNLPPNIAVTQATICTIWLPSNSARWMKPRSKITEMETNRNPTMATEMFKKNYIKEYYDIVNYVNVSKSVLIKYKHYDCVENVV